MNLADITTKCYILALIIRDDGERLLLGDGAYEFKDSQQHFIANTYANDVVELQGTDGQMLAGQVRRTATQTFAGYIGDATFSKQKIEEARRDFLMFFRKKHYYTAVYVFSDGTAIQRDRGYIVNAPSVPELYQRYPEWSVGLNFEDPNYYEYAEDDLGHEIAAHKVELELSTAMSGGLIWDQDGAVSDDLSYVGTEIEGEGTNFQLADTGTATLKSAELLGDAEQDGTPTPDSPVPISVVTGENVVKITEKNLFNQGQYTGGSNSGLTTTFATDKITVAGTTDSTHYPTYIMYADGSTATSQWWATANAINTSKGQFTGGGTYTLSIEATGNIGGNATGFEFIIGYMDGTISGNAYVNQTTKKGSITATKPINFVAFGFRPSLTYDTTFTIQLEEGGSVSQFEPYQGQEFPIDLGSIELAKIGNYQDRIYKTDGKWYIEKQVGKVVLSSSDVGRNGSYTNVDYATLAKPADSFMYGNYDSPVGKTISSCAIPSAVPGSFDYATYVGKLLSQPSQNKFWIGFTKGTSLEDMQSALDGQAVYYALATPTTTEITNTELIRQLERLRHAHTYADTTNFSITATSPNLPAFLKVVAFGEDAIPQGGYVWEDGGSGGATTITVDGVDNAQPIWTVVGPATNPSLTNITTGESIQWTGVVPNGQTLVVNMADMTASLSGANVFEFISGSWITLQAGNNRVSYSATAATGIATLEWNGVVG